MKKLLLLLPLLFIAGCDGNSYSSMAEADAACMKWSLDAGTFRKGYFLGQASNQGIRSCINETTTRQFLGYQYTGAEAGTIYLGHLGDTPTGILETPFLRRGNSAYVVVEGPTWNEAEANANKLGGNLVAINDAHENQWLTKVFKDFNKSYISDNVNPDIYWIGLTKASYSWRWSSGDHANYFNWGPKEPYEDNWIYDRGEIVLEGNPYATNWEVSAGSWNNTHNNGARYGIAEVILDARVKVVFMNKNGNILRPKVIKKRFRY